MKCRGSDLPMMLPPMRGRCFADTKIKKRSSEMVEESGFDTKVHTSNVRKRKKKLPTEEAKKKEESSVETGLNVRQKKNWADNLN